MPKLVPSPQAIIDRLQRLLPLPVAERSPIGPTTEERILDAALAGFASRGVKATTMSQLARDTGISREWLYKHFRNRDAVLIAVAHRELFRFIDGLAKRAYDAEDVSGAVIDAFVYSVEFLRDHELLQRVLTTEPEIVNPQLVRRALPTVGLAVQAASSYLVALGFDGDQAAVIAETLVRLVATITFAPKGQLDLHHSPALRAYASTIVPALLRAGAVSVIAP
jgi:AcrR family transcriptional regulator